MSVSGSCVGEATPSVGRLDAVRARISEPGAKWCRLTSIWCRLVRKSAQRTPPTRRFSVTLNEDDYERLRELAEKRRPALSLQYVTEYAVQLLLKLADEQDVAQTIGNPLAAVPEPRRRRR